MNLAKLNSIKTNKSFKNSDLGLSSITINS